MIDRVKTAIAQSQAILDTMPPSAAKQNVAFAISIMKAIADDIEEKGIPCPPELEARVDEALKSIEELYHKTASN